MRIAAEDGVGAGFWQCPAVAGNLFRSFHAAVDRSGSAGLHSREKPVLSDKPFTVLP